MRNLLHFFTAVAGFFLQVAPVHAFLPGGAIEIGVQITWNSDKSSNVVACENTQVVDPRTVSHWWIRLLEPGNENFIECGIQPDALPIQADCGAENPQCTLAKGSITSHVKVQMEDERAVNVVMDSTVGNITTRDVPENTGSNFTLRRNFNFTENRAVSVPLEFPDLSSVQNPDYRQVFVRLEVKERISKEQAVFGQVWLNSPMANAEIYLDGGQISTLAGEDHLLLKNVTAGMHVIEARGSEGQSASKPVRVISGRRVYANLDPVQEEKPSEAYRLESIGENSSGYQEFVRGQDGAIVVRIPEGEFLMGNEDTERSPLEHKVYLSEYLMDKTGVTWGQYKKYLDSTGLPFPPHDPYWGINDNEPAVFVTWEEAGNYCEWAGGRLPTEAEREKAARGTDDRKFPWGDEEPGPELGVFRKSWGYEGPAPVGQRPKGASPYGLLDMGGNVWEWCSDWYGHDYYETSPYRNPLGPESGTAHVVRGGSWDSRPTVLSSSCRSWGHLGYRDGDFGFRCAMNATGKKK